MNFRYDINGLRAIAVIAVVLFHFNPAWVPGGFAGVDVFFVISGFLMTGIIFRGLENDNFNLFRFYIARANRIIPALAVLCLVLLVFGWFYLSPLDYRALGKHVVSSMWFLSNIIYWRESGYFAAESHEIWLLHTWSLSVEWQFYILYPIVLVALKKFISLENLKLLIVAGIILGFSLSVLAAMTWPNAAYYLLPTRAWEMMMGGVAFLYPWSVSEIKKKVLEFVGLVLIFASYFFASSGLPWPGYWALIPVLGSYFMIVANQQSSLITNNKVLQLLGKWSYSIYLWHWPIVVAIQYFNLDGYFTYLGILLSVLFGMLSHSYIESVKFRNNFYDISSYLKCKPLFIVILVSVLGLALLEMDGFDFRSKNINYSYSIEKERLIPNHGLSDECEGEFTLSSLCRTDERPEVLFFGDSFVMHLVPGVLSSNPKAKIIQHTKSSCGPFFEITKNKTPEFAESCLEFTQKVKDWLINSEGIKTVVMASPFDYIGQNIRFRDGSERKITIDELNYQFTLTLDFFVEQGIRPVVFTPPPETGANFGKCLTFSSFMNESYNRCDFKINEITTRQKDIYTWLDSVSDKYTVIDVREMLCRHGKCSTHNGNTYIYRDRQHLSYEGSRKLGEKFDFYKLITQ